MDEENDGKKNTKALEGLTVETQAEVQENTAVTGEDERRRRWSCLFKMGLYEESTVKTLSQQIFLTYDGMMLTHSLSPGRRAVRTLRTPAS